MDPPPASALPAHEYRTPIRHPDRRAVSQSALLRSARFAPLFWTQFLGALNDNVFRFALVIFVTFTVAEQSGVDTRMLVPLTGGVFILPFFLFSALAGQLADCHDKARLIRLVKTAEILIAALGAFAFWREDYHLLLGVLFLMGTHSTFFGPLKYAILPQHLAEHELTGGNGLIQMGTYVAILAGGMLGGVLAGLERGGPFAVVATVGAIAVAGRVAAAAIPPAPASAPALVLDWHPLRSTWRLLRAAAAVRETWILVLLISLFWFLGATYLALVPTYGKNLLGADEHAVTLLNTAFTIGIGSGSLACERLSRGRIELGLVPLAGFGLALAAADVWLAGTPPPPAATTGFVALLGQGPALRFFLDLVLVGACGALYIVPLYAALQARVAAAGRARAIAVLNVVNALFMVLSALFTMALYGLELDVTAVFGLTALLGFAGLVAGMLALPEFGQRLRALVLPGRR